MCRDRCLDVIFTLGPKSLQRLTSVIVINVVLEWVFKLGEVD